MALFETVRPEVSDLTTNFFPDDSLKGTPMCKWVSLVEKYLDATSNCRNLPMKFSVFGGFPIIAFLYPNHEYRSLKKY